MFYCSKYLLILKHKLVFVKFIFLSNLQSQRILGRIIELNDSTNKISQTKVKCIIEQLHYLRILFE